MLRNEEILLTSPPNFLLNISNIFVHLYIRNTKNQASETLSRLH